MTEETVVSGNRVVLLAALLLLSPVRTLCGAIELPSSIPVTWSSKHYVTKLGPPHGTITIIANFGDDGGLINILIRSKVTDACIQGKMIEGLTDLSEPDISIPVEDSSVLPGRFTISFEYGPKYRVNIASCDETGLNCVDWVQDIVSFEINSDGEVARKTHDVGMRLEEKN